MAADYLSHVGLALGTRTNSSFTKPTGLADGHGLACFLMTGGPSAVAATPPSGFTALPGFPLEVTKADPWTMRLYGWHKSAGGSEPASYTFTHSSGSTEGVLYGISGDAVADPVEPDPATTNTTTSGGVETLAGITTAEANSLVILVASVWDDVGSAAPPGGSTPTFTERYDPGASGVVYSCTGVMASAGATGSKQINTSNQNGNPYLGALVAFRGAGVGGGGGGGLVIPVAVHHYRRMKRR